jgi:hypothetical protein
MDLVLFNTDDTDFIKSLEQGGAGMAIYKGSPMQRGGLSLMPLLRTIGPAIRGVAKAWAPVIKDSAKDFARETLKGAANAALDAGTDKAKKRLMQYTNDNISPEASQLLGNSINTVRRAAKRKLKTPKSKRKRQRQTLLD